MKQLLCFMLAICACCMLASASPTATGSNIPQKVMPYFPEITTASQVAVPLTTCQLSVSQAMQQNYCAMQTVPQKLTQLSTVSVTSSANLNSEKNPTAHLKNDVGKSPNQVITQSIPIIEQVISPNPDKSSIQKE